MVSNCVLDRHIDTAKHIFNKDGNGMEMFGTKKLEKT
jgi:hypothetical protein